MSAASQNVFVLGAGGHSRAVVAAFSDPVAGHVGPGLAMCDDELLQRCPNSVRLLNGIGFVGTDRVRRYVHERYLAAGFEILGVRHPFSSVDPGAWVAQDAQVMIGAVVVAGASVGRGAIVNSGAVIEHDVVVDAHSHIGPGSVLCGGVRVGQDVFVGAGAVVLPGVELGNGSIVGAGSVVREHLAEGCRAVGAPARTLGVEV